MFRNVAVKNPEQLRKALLKGDEFITSPKKFMNKSGFADLKQDARLMHQFYSEKVNAPIELNK